MALHSRSRLNRGIIFLSFLSLGILGLGWTHLNQEVHSLTTVDAQSGKVLWSTSIDDVAPIRRIINHAGQVYTLAASRKESCGNWCVYIPFLSPTNQNVPGITQVTAFDATSGKQLWQFRTNNSNVLDWADMQVTDQSVFLKTDKLTALDPTTGQIQRSIPLPANSQLPYEGAPSFNPNLVVSGDRVALLRVLETSNQLNSKALIETWQKTTGKQHQIFMPTPSSADFDGSSLAATNDTILLFLPWERTAKISGYAADTGKLKFSITTVVRQGVSVQDFYRNVLFSGSTIYQYIYSGSNRGKSVITVEAYDANTGKLRWQAPISDSRCVNFGAVPDGFYLSCYSSFSASTASLKFLDEKTGQQRWMKRFPEATDLRLASTSYSPYISLEGYRVTSDAIVGFVNTKEADGVTKSSRLVAFSTTDGRELWSVADLDFETSIYGADDDRVFLSTKVSRLSNLGLQF
ncbi:PQQ-binding-like beta-propeller repeat protein [Leptolyngbya sp. AN03gr2]|uniref:outer membrane protein assembly factor BamB family protein n=1 Tax=unclassified Leptolyngbya TaxID=2650499 RepID=UPI003D3181A0